MQSQAFSCRLESHANGKRISLSADDGLISVLADEKRTWRFAPRHMPPGADDYADGFLCRIDVSVLGLSRALDRQDNQLILWI